MSEVELRNLSKWYGQEVIVSSLNLEIAEKSFFSLLGPSGCGKTTILRMIAGLEEPTGGKISLSGQVVFDGEKINVPPEKRNLGMVFQSYAVWPHLSVFENVAFPLRCRKEKKPVLSERVTEALAAVRLQGLENRKPHQLSGGQQQRVALARALVARPRVLLLDEPLSNLDANLRDEMCEEFVKLRGFYPVTMVYVTHDQSEAFRLSDRIALLCKGNLDQVGTPKELREKPQTEFVRRFLNLTC